MAPRLATEPEMLTEKTGAAAVGHHNKHLYDPNTEPQTMRALRIVAPHRIEVQEIEIPQPGPGQVRVRIHGCGVCGSDLSRWQGRPWFDYPRAPGTPGHQGWGVVGGTGCARVIEAAGAQETLDLAGALIAVRGRLVIVGYHQDSNRVVNLQLWNWRGIDVINAHERDPAMRTRGMSAAARLIGSGVIDPACLYTHAFALDRAAESFAALETRPEGF